MIDAGPHAGPVLLLHLGWDARCAAELQRRFTAGRTSLLGAGVRYPVSDGIPTADHHDHLAEAFAGQDGGAEAARALREELGDAHTVLLSSTRFASLREQGIRNLAAAFDGFAIRPVAVVSNFSDWLDHQYGQRVLTDHTLDRPAVANFEGKLLGRLAAWASVAANGSIQVVDADAATADAPREVLAALGLDGVLSDLPSAAGPSQHPAAPAVVALVRELRRRGVADEDLRTLTTQLAGVPFTEHQTNLSPGDAAALDQRYAAFHDRLRQAPFVRWRGPVAEPSAAADRVHIQDAAAAVFAIGRALDP